MRWFAAVAASLAGAALFRLGLHAAIRRALAAPRLAHSVTPAALALPFTVERIPTARQRSLHGWLILPANRQAPYPAVIVIHGWGGNAGMMLPFARMLYERGLAALFIDARCHGASDDDSFASLPRFAEDIEHAWCWLRARPEIDGKRIAVIGHSVGAAAALLAASRQPEIRAVVSIAAFAHPATMMRRWLAEKHIPYPAIGHYILAYVERTIGHHFTDIAPLNTIGRIHGPVLLVQGTDDAVVPRQDAEQIFEARSHDGVRLLVVNGRHNSFPESTTGMQGIAAFLRDSLSSTTETVQPDCPIPDPGGAPEKRRLRTESTKKIPLKKQ